MKVKCIMGWKDYITIGKTYDVVEFDMYYYKIIDNTGYINLYFKEYFKPLSEIRAETINKLLEDES